MDCAVRDSIRSQSPDPAGLIDAADLPRMVDIRFDILAVSHTDSSTVARREELLDRKVHRQSSAPADRRTKDENLCSSAGDIWMWDRIEDFSTDRGRRLATMSQQRWLVRLSMAAADASLSAELELRALEGHCRYVYELPPVSC